MTMITLPPVMDRTTTGALVKQLDQALVAGAAITVEGRDVNRIGQSGLQLLLSAQLTAQARSAQLTVRPSQAMIGAGHVAGLADTFNWGTRRNDQ